MLMINTANTPDFSQLTGLNTARFIEVFLYMRHLSLSSVQTPGLSLDLVDWCELFFLCFVNSLLWDILVTSALFSSFCLCLDMGLRVHYTHSNTLISTQ